MPNALTLIGFGQKQNHTKMSELFRNTILAVKWLLMMFYDSNFGMFHRPKKFPFG